MQTKYSRKQNIVIISLMISILIITGFSSLLTYIVKTTKVNKPDCKLPSNNIIAASEVHNMANGINDTVYNSNTEFEITTTQGYYNFVNSTMRKNSATFLDDYVVNYTYENKIVHLRADVFVDAGVQSRLSILEFRGIFDGHGYTITASNNWIQPSFSFLPTYWDTQCVGGFSLFNYGEIKNVCFDNWYLYNKFDGWNNSWLNMSVVSTYNYGRIHSCIVQNYKFLAGMKNTVVAPLACYNYGTVENNIVKGNANIGSDGSRGVTLKSHWLVAYGNTTVGEYLRGNVFRAGETGIQETKDVYGVEHLPYPGGTNVRNYTDLYDRYSFATTDLGSFEDDDSLSDWYQYKSREYGYNKDEDYCVYLRAFIPWIRYEFDASPSDCGSVNANIIVAPRDYASATVSNVNRSIDIDYVEVSITAKPSTNCEFHEWKDEGEQSREKFYYYRKFTALFQRCVNVSFVNPDNLQVDLSQNTNLNTEYFLMPGDVIYIFWENPLSANGCYNSVKFSFTDKFGDERSFTYYLGNTQTAYYIYGSNVADTQQTSVVINEDFLNIKPSIRLKSYNVIFK